MTRCIPATLLLLVLLGAPWADAATQTTAAEVAATRQRAEQGDAGAQWELAGRYGTGIGVPFNDVEAVAWYRQAADQGLAGAQYDLGVMYRDGRGMPQDYTQAIAWWHKAADQGYWRAHRNLG